MDNCNIKFNGNNSIKLKVQINTVLLGRKTPKEFIDSFFTGDIPELINFTKDLLMSDDELAKYVDTINNSVENIISAILEKNIANRRLSEMEANAENLKLAVHSKLHIVLDESQSGYNEESEDIEEAKDKEELKDIYRSNLGLHTLDIYGSDSYLILKDMLEQFSDDVTAASYWDIESGDIIYRDNLVLNEKFMNLKLRYFKLIVNFLKSQFPDDKDVLNLSTSFFNNRHQFSSLNYLGALDRFYKYIKQLKTFKSEIQSNLSDKVLEKDRRDNIVKYLKLLKLLKTNSDFTEKLEKKFLTSEKQILDTALYEADHLSRYYATIKKIATDLKLLDLKDKDNKSVAEYFEDIEVPKTNLLEATNSYTCLVHFDELLSDRFNNNFIINNGMKGIEIGDYTKYEHHKDTSHEKKSWTQSELIASEKYIATLTKLIFNQIRIFDFKNNTFKNKRLDSTAFIVAARNLLNDIVYNNITWSGIDYEADSKYRKGFDEFVKTVIDLHANPKVKLQTILEFLFEKVEGKTTGPYYLKMGKRKLLNDYDLDVLYSVYQAVFNKHNPNSLISKELEFVKEGNGVVQDLVQEISGYVDRNTTMDYLETSYNFETREVTVKVKKKFFNNIELYKLKLRINRNVNKKSKKDLQYVHDVYPLSISETSEGRTHYTTTIGNNKFELSVPNVLGGKILLNSNSVNFSNENKEIFKRLNKLDLVKFRFNVLNHQSLSEDESILYDILKFIDNTLGLDIVKKPSLGLQILLVYKTIYNPVTDKVVGNNYIQPLLQLAMRARFVMEQYYNADGIPLKKYLENINDTSYSNYTFNKKKSRLFTELYNNVKYVIADYNDEVLDLWTDANSMLNGDASKATTKDKEGHGLPNNSVNKLGANLYYYLLKQKETNCSPLLFVNSSSLIRQTFHDLEVTNWDNESKAIKRFSSGELFHHAIFNKFWGNYFNTGNVIIQPTTYSDKTTFINYGISTKLNGKDDILKSVSYKDDIVKYYINTIGRMYKNVWRDTQIKLLKVADVYNSENNTDLSFKEVLKNLSESELIEMSKKAGVILELDKDYRNIKVNGKNVTASNEELEYYATNLYQNEESLNKMLEVLKRFFVLNLIDSNSAYQVIDFGDSLKNYLDDALRNKRKSSNTIIDTINKFFENDSKGKKEFMQNWVDEKTGKLIIAKLGKKEIKGLGDVFNKSEDVVLNPLFDRFFYLEGLLSNNLRMSLTASEINHPDKAKKTTFKILKDADLESAETTLKSIYDKEFESDNLNNVLTQIRNTDYVGDLIPKNISKLKLSLKEKDMLTAIYNSSLLMISNVSQGTLFKRNVIIPATLQYCQQNTRTGISPKIKCAVIRDEQAPVYNYRGDHEEDIDSADGSAWINPFLSILENKCLDSLAVGFTKKPIWHSYDSESCTAFLAKFATDTITNESMRMSFGSHTKLFNLFKKMTNLLWDSSVNLNLTIIDGDLSKKSSKIAAFTKFFNVELLGNRKFEREGKVLYTNLNRLIYKNAYDDMVEITNFGSTITDGKILYYTKENNFIENIDINNPPESKLIFHIFYDAKDESGNIIEKSRHLTFDTYQKALAFLESEPSAHTINSLYELHTALGGINCVDSKGNYSEFSNEVVVNFMNNIGYRKEGIKDDDTLDLETCVLTLKELHIGYALNNTAVKNGAKNINLENAWYDDSDLNYFEVDSDGLGMQMNADHEIIGSELTEFSQVVTATSAYGYTLDLCNEIFQGLARAALIANKTTLDAVNNFLKVFDDDEKYEKAQSTLYDAIGRIILTNQQIKDKESLQSVIMEAVTQVFYKSRNHKDDDIKIPFSDANIFSQFVADLASMINKESIKRKHPGSGCVMVPGYNMMQYYDITDMVDGKPVVLKLMAFDAIKLAREDYKNELIELLKAHKDFNAEKLVIITEEGNTYYIKNKGIKNLEESLAALNIENTTSYKDINLDLDVNTYNRKLLNIFLNKKQAEARVFEDRSWFMPSDIVDIVDENNNVHTYDLNTLDNYYKFTDGLCDTEIEHNVTIKAEYSKSKFTISLNDDPSSRFVIERTRDLEGRLTNEYNIHFKTGGFSDNIARRTPWLLKEGQTKEDLEAKKIRLFRAALEVIPDGGILSLSNSTKSEIETKRGGLTKGSYSGYTSLFDGKHDDRKKGINLVKIGEPYLVTFFDKDSNKITESVYKYKKISHERRNNKYRVNITSPHNLRPSLIRWKYKTGNENLNEGESYMNIFDTEAVKNSYIYPKDRDADYRNQILETLNLLEKGKFVLNGEERDIIEGSLENTAAELIMSNLYKDKFGIEDESLSEVLRLGLDYFRNKQIENRLREPSNNHYDIAFLKENGKHTLISLKPVKTNEFVREDAFKLEDLYTDENDEIKYVRKNRELFKVGKWVDASEEIDFINDVFIDKKTGKVLDDLDMYRLKDAQNKSQIQKRVDYVKRYIVSDKYSKNGKIFYKQNILYSIADLDDIKKALNDALGGDASRQRSKIIYDIFKTDSFEMAGLNYQFHNYTDSFMNHIISALSMILDDLNSSIHRNIKDLLSALITKTLKITKDLITPEKESKEEREERIKKLRDTMAANKKMYEELKTKFFEESAHNKWVSFLDSLNFISARIPAQTLQSFMTMKTVAWTGNSKNMAYVSHFLTYLQGSDYDIDKAYIMGQSYDSNGVYIGWSNLFDYTSYETLQESKKIPLPKGKVITINEEEGIDVSKYLKNIIELVDAEGRWAKANSFERVKILKNISAILRIVDENNGKIKYSLEGYSKHTIRNIIQTLLKHEDYKIPINVSEQAFKNVASANIYAVSHDIRNRDLAYTAISMKILQKAAEKSPKGNQAADLNMLNPFTKYIMLYLNLVGKNVISIAANGEKVWFNTYYYWHKVLLSGNEDKIHRLMFSLTFNRIKGRAKEKEEPETVTYLPDLNIYDEKIKNALKELFHVDSPSYKYVDLLISLLLSAATDNAKELILAKINAGTNFAKMYVYGIMMGFDINDIIAFMTSPVSEFIDKMSNQNMFSDLDMHNNPSMAINLMQGIIGVSKFLHGTVSVTLDDLETGLEIQSSENKGTHIYKAITRNKPSLIKDVRKELELKEDEQLKGISLLMKGIIKVCIKSDKYDNLDLTKLVKTKDVEINSYLEYCKDVIKKLKEVKDKYETFEEFEADVEEFKKLFDLSSEITSISSAWLGLNQGLPTDLLGVLKRLANMSKLVYDREKILGIKKSNIYNNEEEEEEEEDPEELSFWETVELKKRKKSDKEITENKINVINTIKKNNPTLSEEEIIDALDNAYKDGIMNNFDITKYFEDASYREKAKAYYNILKGTINVMELFEELPLYDAIRDCFKVFNVGLSFAQKNRMVTQLVKRTKANNISDLQLKGIIRYIDKSNSFRFVRTLNLLVLKEPTEGFDIYFLDKSDISVIDFSTLDGLATFKKWMETDFLNYLNKYESNPLVKHLSVIPTTNTDVLATDVDLLNPNTTTVSRESYNEILRGMAEFEKIKYDDNQEYSIVDLLQIYNIVVNNNMYGSERLTTAFKVCTNRNNILNRFLKDVGDYDYDMKNDSEVEDSTFDYTDYLINSAPVISSYSERFHKEPFVKVTDPVRGFILKKLNKSNEYEEYSIIPGTKGYEDETQFYKRLENYSEYSVFELPNYHKKIAIIDTINFDGLFDTLDENALKELITDIYKILKDQSISSKILIIENCK